LLTREQLSDLILALDRILQAMLEAKMTNMDFFDSLQGLAVQSMKRPEGIAQVDNVRQSGLVPKFIESLPYRSEVLSLDRDSYASLSAEQRAELLSHLTAKLNQYVKISEMVDGWTLLNPQSGGRKVFPLQLDYLP
jgi:serine/threonine-protein kinase PpkA